MKTIWIIDDEPAIRALLGEYLIGCGFNVVTFGSAEEVRVMASDGPHLVISDLQLEDADGLEMIAQLKDKWPTIPVILLTGVIFEPEVVREILGKHVASYLPKTSSLAEISATVRRCLDIQAGSAPPLS